jgi:hypothetical protein
MIRNRSKEFPRWIFSILGAAAFIATGIYLEKGVLQGFSTGTIVRIVVLFVLGCLWTWGAMGTRGRAKKSE